VQKKNMTNDKLPDNIVRNTHFANSANGRSTHLLVQSLGFPDVPNLQPPLVS
jgi:hypothetical protein